MRRRQSRRSPPRASSPKRSRKSLSTTSFGLTLTRIHVTLEQTSSSFLPSLLPILPGAPTLYPKPARPASFARSPRLAFNARGGSRYTGLPDEHSRRHAALLSSRFRLASSGFKYLKTGKTAFSTVFSRGFHVFIYFFPFFPSFSFHFLPSSCCLSAIVCSLRCTAIEKPYPRERERERVRLCSFHGVEHASNSPASIPRRASLKTFTVLPPWLKAWALLRAPLFRPISFRFSFPSFPLKHLARRLLDHRSPHRFVCTR